MANKTIHAELLQTYLSPGAKILIAVSGGPDSVALAHFLKSLPYRLVLGHVDHGLRHGSSADAQFVQRLAKEWEIPCFVARVKVGRYAARQKIGLEEAARELRYRALARMARQNHCLAIVTAHTANDQAETVLMNFLRGSGPAGLAGIPIARRLSDSENISLIRPFLGVNRDHIISYLRRHFLAYRTDPSNRSLRFTRNRIRHSTLPYLEKLYPGLSERLIKAADIFRQEEDFWQGRVLQELQKTVRKDGRKITVVLPQLLRYHKSLSRRILRQTLPGLSFQDIEDVFTLARSPERTAWLELSGWWRIRRNDQKMIAFQKRIG